MRREVLLDTGPLLGLLSERDQHHQEAVSAFARLTDEGATLLCPLTSALELHRALLYVKPPRIAEATATVQQILGAYPLLTPEARDVRTGLEHLARYPDQAISLFDAITASMAKRTGTSVLTFDARHFSLLGAKVYR